MITGIAVLGVLAGSLASLFNLEPVSDDENGGASTDAEHSVPAELAMLQAQLVRSSVGSASSRTRYPLRAATPSSSDRS